MKKYTPMVIVMQLITLHEKSQGQVSGIICAYMMLLAESKHICCYSSLKPISYAYSRIHSAVEYVCPLRRKSM